MNKKTETLKKEKGILESKDKKRYEALKEKVYEMEKTNVRKIIIFRTGVDWYKIGDFL